MKIKIIGPALFACIALVQGCATPLQQITHEETTRVISYYTSLPASSQSKREVTEWVQADNKLEECKFFMGGDDPWWNEDGSSNFWDGDCKNGYAYGTGREFSTSNKHGKANTLSVYSGGEIPPKYYTAELNDKKVFIEGDISKVGVSGNIIEVIDDLGLFNIKVTRGTVSKAGSFMEKVDLRSSEKRRVKVYPNGFSYVFLTDNDPTADLQFSAHTMLDNNYVGFAINKYRSGAVEHISMLSGQPVYVSLPQSYLNHLQMVENEIDAKIQESEQKTKISDEVMATYKSRVCQGKPHFDFVTDEIYGMVCLEAGPLTPYKAQAEAVVKIRNNEIAARVAAERASDVSQQNMQAQALQGFVSAFADMGVQFNQDATALREKTQLQNQQRPQWGQNNNVYGTPVYKSSQCTGSVVNGVCTGAIIPSGIPQKCYGTMLNGQCMGPQF